MNRQHLIEQLHAHQPSDEHERAMRDRVVAFVQANENCASRGLLIGHLTGSAWVINAEATHALLTHHRKLDLWVQLGGHCENDASMLEASLREAREESGLHEVHIVSENIFDVDIHAIPARRDEPEHFHYDIRYLLRADHRAPLVVSSESKDLVWMPLDEIAQLTHEESVLRMVRKTRQLSSALKTEN